MRAAPSLIDVFSRFSSRLETHFRRVSRNLFFLLFFFFFKASIKEASPVVAAFEEDHRVDTSKCFTLYGFVFRTFSHVVLFIKHSVLTGILSVEMIVSPVY